MSEVIGRRQTLKYVGLLVGTAAGREFLSKWLPAASAAVPGGCPPEIPDQRAAAPQNSAPYAPQFFKPDEFKTVEALTERIIPSDGTPGAKEAQVAAFIDFIVFSAAEFRPELQRQWTDGLNQLDRLSREKHQQPFAEVPPPGQEALLMEMSLPERTPGAEHPGFAFYRLVKEMTVEGFYSSRVGLIDVLEYKGLAVMSEFPGCTHPEHQA